MMLVLLGMFTVLLFSTVQSAAVSMECPVYKTFYCTCNDTDMVKPIPLKTCLKRNGLHNITCDPCPDQEQLNCSACPDNQCPICSPYKYGSGNISKDDIIVNTTLQPLRENNSVPSSPGMLDKQHEKKIESKATDDLNGHFKANFGNISKDGIIVSTTLQPMRDNKSVPSSLGLLDKRHEKKIESKANSNSKRHFKASFRQANLAIALHFVRNSSVDNRTEIGDSIFGSNNYTGSASTYSTPVTKKFKKSGKQLTSRNKSKRKKTAFTKHKESKKNHTMKHNANENSNRHLKAKFRQVNLKKSPHFIRISPLGNRTEIGDSTSGISHTGSVGNVSSTPIAASDGLPLSNFPGNITTSSVFDSDVVSIKNIPKSSSLDSQRSSIHASQKTSAIFTPQFDINNRTVPQVLSEGNLSGENMTRNTSPSHLHDGLVKETSSKFLSTTENPAIKRENIRDFNVSQSHSNYTANPQIFSTIHGLSSTGSKQYEGKNQNFEINEKPTASFPTSLNETIKIDNKRYTASTKMTTQAIDEKREKAEGSVFFPEGISVNQSVTDRQLNGSKNDSFGTRLDQSISSYVTDHPFLNKAASKILVNSAKTDEKNSSSKNILDDDFQYRQLSPSVKENANGNESMKPEKSNEKITTLLSSRIEEHFTHFSTESETIGNTLDGKIAHGSNDYKSSNNQRNESSLNIDESEGKEKTNNIFNIQNQTTKENHDPMVTQTSTTYDKERKFDKSEQPEGILERNQNSSSYSNQTFFTTESSERAERKNVSILRLKNEGVKQDQIREKITNDNADQFSITYPYSSSEFTGKSVLTKVKQWSGTKDTGNDQLHLLPERNFNGNEKHQQNSTISEIQPGLIRVRKNSDDYTTGIKRDEVHTSSEKDSFGYEKKHQDKIKLETHNESTKLTVKPSESVVKPMTKIGEKENLNSSSVSSQQPLEMHSKLLERSKDSPNQGISPNSDTEVKHNFDTKFNTGRKLLQFTRDGTSELVVTHFVHARSNRIRRLAQDFPHNNWCVVPNDAYFGQLQCNIWSYQKVCTMSCSGGQGANALVFQCNRKKNVWEPKMQSCPNDEGNVAYQAPKPQQKAAAKENKIPPKDSKKAPGKQSPTDEYYEYEEYDYKDPKESANKNSSNKKSGDKSQPKKSQDDEYEYNDLGQ